MTPRPKAVVVFPYEDEYGPFRTLRFALKGLDAAGYDAVCVVPKGAAVLARLAELGVEARGIDHLRTFPRTVNPARLSAFLHDHLAATDAIAELARTEQAALVYSLSEGILCGSLAAARLELPSVVHVIGLSIGTPNWTGNIYIRALARLTTRFVATSAAVAAMLEKHGAPDVKISVVHCGVPIAAIDATAGKPSPIDFDGPKIGMVAAFDPRKGHDLFVAAAAQLAHSHPEARFYIVGGVIHDQAESIRFAARIRELIAATNLHDAVVLTGRVGAEEVYPWIRALDVFVLPSRTEAFGHVQFEAMACGRPVIATRLEGNLDAFVDGESGLHVEPFPDEIARSVARVLAEPDLGPRLGRAARERVVSYFDEGEMVPVFRSVIADLMRGRAAAAV